jgi:hypothetical protein
MVRWLLGAPLLAAAAVLAAAVARPAPARPPGSFDGKRALEDVRRIVAIGPRPAGSPGAARTREDIRTRLTEAGLTAVDQPFDVRTPLGPTHMVNVRATIAGRAPDAARRPRLIVAGHYDTKPFAAFEFVGANDGGSSTAFLLELARVLRPGTLPVDVELLFLDGEESTGDWQGSDHTYGSRHYVEAARQAGELGAIGALVLVDMIGDRDLRILREANSTPWLIDLVWAAARRAGRREFVDDSTPIEDDHLEFLEAGVPAVDIIDLDYPAWHTREDTLDKVSAASLQAVGDVVVAALPEIASRLAR